MKRLATVGLLSASIGGVGAAAAGANIQGGVGGVPFDIAVGHLAANFSGQVNYYNQAISAHKLVYRAMAAENLSEAAWNFSNQLAALTPPAQIYKKYTATIKTLHRLSYGLKLESYDAAAVDPLALKTDTARDKALLTKLGVPGAPKPTLLWYLIHN